MKVKSLSRVRLLVTPWTVTVAHQAPPSMGFSRQEYWSGLPFPSPGDLPNPGIEPGSPAFQADASTSEPPGKLIKQVAPCLDQNNFSPTINFLLPSFLPFVYLTIVQAAVIITSSNLSSSFGTFGSPCGIQKLDLDFGIQKFFWNHPSFWKDVFKFASSWMIRC